MPAAQTDTTPPGIAPATVSADPLPTVQVNGVVWAQTVVGDTVYAVGSFSRARPAGSPAGRNEVARANILAYRLSTGVLLNSFNHVLNAQALAVASSPDGSLIYVGGDFTRVDGVTRGHVAAFTVATGALTNFAGSVSGQAAALVATGSTLYVGGSFAAAGSVVRHNAAAFLPSTGALTPWNPDADSSVNAMTLSPDHTKVVLGGRFDTVTGLSRLGLAAVDLYYGTPTAWTQPPVRDYGVNAAITSLSSDATTIYGTGYNFSSNGGTGNFEGRFAIKDDGRVVWLMDCHGDSYSAFPIGSVLYSVGHAHNCATVGTYPETTPRTWHRALAETTYATHTLLRNKQSGYSNFAGYPAADQLDWYPQVANGTYTGAFQGGWSITGNTEYVAMGGEFPSVNGKAQQGLVRFAVRSLAPNKVGPVTSAALTPTATVTGPTVRLSWGSTYDIDNAVLTYKIYRDGAPNPIGSTSADSRFWTVPGPIQTYIDSPGKGRHSYLIAATDPFGNAVSGATASVTVSSGAAPPTASFTSACTALDCTFNAAASSDPSGSIESYDWQFAPGVTGVGVSASHSYPTPGTYPVTLTVTSASGLTGAQVKVIVVSSSASDAEVLALDDFDRTASGGLGTAGTGGPWTTLNSPASLSVVPAAASIGLSAAGRTTSAILGSVSARDVVISTTVSLDSVANGGGTYFSLLARRIDDTHQYRGSIRILATGVVQLYLTKLNGSNTEVAVGAGATLSAVTYTPGMVLHAELTVVGSGTTTLKLKVWPAGTAEPVTAQVTGSDTSSALQVAGAVGFRAYLSGTATNAPLVVTMGPFGVDAPA